jgi:hypothetical protein
MTWTKYNDLQSNNKEILNYRILKMSYIRFKSIRTKTIIDKGIHLYLKYLIVDLLMKAKILSMKS